MTKVAERLTLKVPSSVSRAQLKTDRWLAYSAQSCASSLKSTRVHPLPFVASPNSNGERETFMLVSRLNESKRARIFLLLLALFLPSITRAERLPLKTYTVADGLAHNVVNKIVR